MYLKKKVFNTLLRLVEFKISLNPHLTCLFRVGFFFFWFSRHFFFILDFLKFLAMALRLRLSANTAASASHHSPTFSMVAFQAKTVSNSLKTKSGKSFL